MADKKNGGGIPQATKEAISKMEGVRRALADLGKDAKPLQIKDYLKAKYGIEISTDVISAYKATIAQKAKKKKAAAAKPPAAAKPSMQPTPAPVPTNKTGGFSLEDIQTAKALLARVGAEQLQKLIDLLAK
jgi:hypothetical protein